MKNLLLLLLALRLYTTLPAQSLYIIDNQGLLHNVNLATCEVSELGDANAFTDISFDSQGNLIGVINSSIYLIDSISGDNLGVIHQFDVNGLVGNTVSNEGVHYVVSSSAEIHSYDPATGVEDSIIELDMVNGGGDLTFSYGVLYYAASISQIISFDLNNNVASDPFMIEGINGTILGLSSNVDDCKQTTYACAFNGGAAGTTTIYEVDFNTNIPTEICTIEVPVFGSAFRNEHLASLDSATISMPCDTIINNIELIDAAEISVFPNPVNDVLYLPSSYETVYIFSIDGKQQNFELIDGKNQVDVSSLSKGLYILRIGNKTKRFVKM